MKGNRATSFGYGMRTKFELASKNVPSPSQYKSTHSDFEVIKEENKSKGYTFGLSRVAVGKRYVHSECPVDPIVPGPGTYKEKANLGKDGHIYSMSTKASINYGRKPAPDFPGPGKYEPVNPLTKSGSYFLSKFSSSGAQKISPPSSKRFTEIS